MIFYFSGTGNSQLAAKQIAETTGDEICMEWELYAMHGLYLSLSCNGNRVQIDHKRTAALLYNGRIVL